MYVCMYVCMYACMYVCTYVRTYVCMFCILCPGTCFFTASSVMVTIICAKICMLPSRLDPLPHSIPTPPLWPLSRIPFADKVSSQHLLTRLPSHPKQPKAPSPKMLNSTGHIVYYYYCHTNCCGQIIIANSNQQ